MHTYFCGNNVSHEEDISEEEKFDLGSNYEITVSSIRITAHALEVKHADLLHNSIIEKDGKLIEYFLYQYLKYSHLLEMYIAIT